MNAEPTIGHNRPPDAIDDAIAPFADWMGMAKDWMDGQPVTDDVSLAEVDNILTEIKAAKKAVGEARDGATKPLHKAWQDEIARWKPTLENLDMLAAGLVSITSEYRKAAAARIEANKRSARAIAEKARLEAEAAAREADAGNIEDQRKAAKARAEAYAAQDAAAEAEMRKVKGLRKVRRFEIQSHKDALAWIIANDRDAVTGFIEAYVAKHHRTANIGGVRQWDEKEAF